MYLYLYCMDNRYWLPDTQTDPVRSHTLTFTGTKSGTGTSVTLHFNPNNGLLKALYLICHFPWNNSVLSLCKSTQTPHPTISKIIPIVSSNLYRLLTTNSFWSEMIVHPCCEILSALHSKVNSSEPAKDFYLKEAFFFDSTMLRDISHLITILMPKCPLNFVQASHTRVHLVNILKSYSLSHPIFSNTKYWHSVIVPMLYSSIYCYW